MNRRTFLKSSAVATSAGPLFLGTTARAATITPVIGVDGHKYECNHNWGELPNDYEWQTTHNVAIDSHGLVYITHQGIGKKMDTILVFDAAGKFVRSFGKEFHGGGHGIEIRKEGSDEFCYLSNTWTPDLKLMKTTLKGDVVWKKGRPECKEYERKPDPKDAKKSVLPNYSPTNICFTPDGGFIVGDGYGSSYMMTYDKDANLKQVFGGPGKGLGQLATPHGNWVDDRNKNHPMVVVCDRANHRLQTFTLDGKAIAATEPDKVVFFPAHAKTRGEELLVADLHCRVSLFDKNNKPIVHLGEQTEEDTAWRKKVTGPVKAGEKAIRVQPKEWQPGRFVHPHDAAFDAAGNIFVAEWVGTGRVTMLKKVG